MNKKISRNCKAGGVGLARLCKILLKVSDDLFRYKQLRYGRNLLVRNPFLKISMFCFLYKGAISRNSLKCFLI